MIKAVGLIDSTKPRTATIDTMEDQYVNSRNVATAATTLNVKKHRNFDMKMGDSPLTFHSRKRFLG